MNHNSKNHAPGTLAASTSVTTPPDPTPPRPAPPPNEEHVEWDPKRGRIYRDLNDRSLLVLTADIDKILVEFTDGTTEVLDIFEWRDLQPVVAIC